MNSSVPLSPPSMRAALTRIAAIRATIAQNSVVLNACLVSVVRRRAEREMPPERALRSPLVTPVLAMCSNSFLLRASRRTTQPCPGEQESPSESHLSGTIDHESFGIPQADAILNTH